MAEFAATKASCLHCGSETISGLQYCCAGCERIYTLLQKKGLQHFYSLRDQIPLGKIFSPAKLFAPELELANTDIPSHQLRQSFYLEGIHCLGCLWLLEKLPEIEPRILSASLDFSHGILHINRDPKISWPEAVSLIRQLGYVPRPLEEDKGEQAQRSDRIQQTIRLGVAGFCAGNIMLLAVSIYGGASGMLAQNFALLSFLIALPALTYSAWPLYRSALLPLRYRRISVDLAVSLAIWVGFGLSIFNLFFGARTETYFDSLTMLVFLLLASRYFLNRFRESLGKEGPCLSLLSVHRYLRTGSSRAEVRAEEIIRGDVILLKTGQTLPADSHLQSPFAHFDLSLLTGESAPVKLFQGDAVDAGAKLLTGEAMVSAIRPSSQSRLAKIVEQTQAQHSNRSASLDFADRMGKRFVVVVLALAALTALFLPFPDGLQRALVLVIVTCPCVLAFAVPLAFTRALQQAARAGILFRSAEKVEELASAKTIFLDKTGTLTEGNFEVVKWNQFSGDEQETRAVALALEKKSHHPVAKAIVRHLDTLSLPQCEIERFLEQPGLGVSGFSGGEEWEICGLRKNTTADNVVGVFRGGKLLASISLGDQLRPGASDFIAELHRLGLRAVILSGDNENRVAAVAKSVGVDGWKSALSPENKAELVRETPRSVMVGDGANDSIAFQASGVGIAMRGAMELSLKNADVVLARPGLDGILKAIRTSRNTMRLVRTAFAVSLSYNVLAGCLALTGKMSPLMAAVLMPISALSVFILIQWNTRKEQE